jgi:hypothetical protein
MDYHLYLNSFCKPGRSGGKGNPPRGVSKIHGGPVWTATGEKGFLLFSLLIH